MRRKLVQMGKYCLMSAIPKKWLKQQELKAGDSIEIEEIENYLIISAKPLTKDKKIELELNTENQIAVSRLMQTVYDAGYKTVNITFSQPKIIQQIMHALQLLDQWQIVESTNKHCLIKSQQPEEQEFQNQFRRLFLLVKEQFMLTKRYLNKKEDHETLKTNHLLILKQSMNIKRRINTNSLPLEYKYYYFIAIQLEEIGEQLDYFIKSIKRTNPRIEQLTNKTANLFENTYKNFYSTEIEFFLNINKKETIWKWYETEENPLQIYHLRAISERIKNIAKYTFGIRQK